MKKSVKAKKRSSVPRDLFAELSEGLEALAEARRQKSEDWSGEHCPVP